MYSSEKVTSNDLNNNPMPEDLKEKLETYMVRLSSYLIYLLNYYSNLNPAKTILTFL